MKIAMRVFAITLFGVFYTGVLYNAINTYGIFSWAFLGELSDCIIGGTFGYIMHKNAEEQFDEIDARSLDKRTNSDSK